MLNQSISTRVIYNHIAKSRLPQTLLVHRIARKKTVLSDKLHEPSLFSCNLSDMSDFSIIYSYSMKVLFVITVTRLLIMSEMMRAKTDVEQLPNTTLIANYPPST